jgi:hypothetical protein
MKKTIIVVSLVLLSLIYADILFAEEKSRVAVLDFAAKNLSKDDADILADFFRSELIKTGKFEVLDRNHISKILDEQHFQSSGTTDAKNAVKIGKLINTQYVFVGAYSKLDSLFMLNIEMVNVKTGKIEKSLNRSVDNPQPKDKLDLARFLAYNFIGFGVGYELFWNGNRVGFEPEWSPEEAHNNLEWNRRTYTDKNIEGYFNGKKMP